ncbi:hypothetical protein ESCO_001200 [Escovopsis weberi]|uniref:Uncharacterized protein n=1 Tax=Escovopsis weberi TaxID=150374 RepID=A0A0M9VTI5_ESCWE|nr:hypothetical protein ESCO_001200 [Escovopsis weberi]
MCDPAELSRVRRLAVSSDVFCVDGVAACLGFSPCGSLLVDVLSQIARKLPDLEELLFVPHEGPASSAGNEDEAVAYERLTCQVQSALQAVCCEMTSWNPPPWRVASLDHLAAHMQVDIPER